MSASAARATARAPRPARPAPRPTARSTGYLRLVTTRRSTAARAPFVAVVVLILAAGLLGLLLLNTVLAQDAFTLHALQVQGRVLADQEQSLQREVERLESPQSLAARATALNMVPGGTRAFLELPSGRVLGIALPAEAPPPVVAAPPAAVPAAAPAAGARQAAPPQAKPKPTAATGGWVAVPAGQRPHQKKPATKASPKP